jgi:hypothetical protein
MAEGISADGKKYEKGKRKRGKGERKGQIYAQ